MFGSSSNSSELMLPILLDMAALLRRTTRPGKETREVTQPYPSYPAPPGLPPQQLLRRSDAGETYMDTHTSLKPEDTNQQTNSNIIQDVTEKTHEILKLAHIENKNNVAVSTEANKQLDKESTNVKITTAQILRRLRSKDKPANAKIEMPKLLRRSYTEDDVENDMFELGVPPAPTQSSNTHKVSQTQRNTEIISNLGQVNNTKPNDRENSNLTNNTDNRNLTRYSLPPAPPASAAQASISRSLVLDNSSLDLMADSSNTTLAQDLPVAERLRALNRYVDRKGNLIRRGTYPPKPYTAPVTRRPALEPAGGAAGAGAVSRRRPPPARKPPPTAPAADTKCELFTNTLCLHADDYPTEAIVSSLRRNKAAAGALLADFQDPGQGALDGVSAAQEAKYTADHYLVSNRRGDTANRDFASAGEAGFMCPSTVKYARPQRARATSGHWKYIVNTGEHTQTLRLEKCLKPKDSCTYLTDNFKSKCVQVYNYHRLLTWDQQNGLHMDIFKVPTCCSCHIEGYSVSFPPLGHRIHETSSEHFPGEDLSSETGNHAFEAVQSTIQRPTITKSPSFIHSKPESFPPFTDNNPNLISVSPFNKAKLTDNDDTGPGNSNPVDSYGNSYFPDSFNQASSIRNVRRPLSARNPTTTNPDSVTLPSYLEPPTPSASNSFTFVKEPSTKFKTENTGSPFKRGAFRPNRRPIRKKISGGPDDLIPQGTSAVESFTSSNMDTVENFDEYQEDPQIGQASVVTNTHHQINHPPPHNVRPTIGPKLQAVTTEKISTTARPQEVKPNVNENFTSNGKRINYNYHPIIDFFGESEKDAEDESIDREDSDSYIAPAESEWKPMNQPPRSSNLVGRKKHK